MRAFETLLGHNDMLAYLPMMAPRLFELRRALKPLATRLAKGRYGNCVHRPRTGRRRPTLWRLKEKVTLTARGESPIIAHTSTGL